MLKFQHLPNKSFELSNWIHSQTFYLGNQEKLIFKDNMTDYYNNLDFEERKKQTKSAWGDINQ